MSKEKKFLVYILLFYTLNIINTYFVTTAVLNRYLVSFSRSYRLELNAIIGNIGILTIILFLGFLWIKSYKKRALFMIITTFFLNVAVFVLGIFTKYYQTIFSLNELTLLKNPAQALGMSIMWESLRELFSYYRIVVFIPTLLMIIYFYYLKKDKDSLFNSPNKPILNYFPLNNIIIIGGLILSLSSLGIFNVSVNRNWRIDAERPLYGVQNAGLYNYYFGQMLKLGYYDESSDKIDKNIYETYNKNKSSYTNIWGESYSNELTLAEASTVWLDGSLHTENLNGIFKDKNLVLIHLESFNYFLLEERGHLDETYYPILKSLLRESYVLDNFYTNVGLGNSSDAEFSVLTGLYPVGDSTIYWKYEDVEYDFDALPKLFHDRISISFHGDVAQFYNRVSVHEEMFGFQDYFYYDKQEPYFSGTKNGYHVFEDTASSTEDSPWVNDKALLNWTKEKYNQYDEPLFLYPINIQPHVPYLYDPYMSSPRFTKTEVPVETTTLRYLNYERYVEEYFKAFIELTHNLKNTVYIFYSDHGSGISKKDYQTVLGYESSIFDENMGPYDNVLTSEEHAKEMLRTLAFIYAPADEDTNTLKKGLIKGSQPKVRSQVDIYRTIIELFGLKSDNHYYGVNVLSDETTFSIDTRTFSIVTDDYYIISKRFYNNKPKENNIVIYNENYRLEPYQVFNYVYLFKERMDKALKTNSFYLLRDENSS